MPADRLLSIGDGQGWGSDDYPEKGGGHLYFDDDGEGVYRHRDRDQRVVGDRELREDFKYVSTYCRDI